MKTEKKYLMYGIALIMITLIGVSLAYFTTEIVGNRKNVSVSTGDLRIMFTDTDGSITGTDIEPGWSTSKTFSVENKTNSSYDYNIVIEDLVNTFSTNGYLVYKITSINGGYNMTYYADLPKSDTSNDAILAYNVSVPSKTIHNYTIEIKYLNDEENSQNRDMNSTLSGSIYISEGTIIPFEENSLAYKVVKDNPVIAERTDFSVTNVANTTGTIYKTTSTEDDSTVYYYSGNTTNNWVYFGDFYWRIIRTNEDGSVRLLYAGTSHDDYHAIMQKDKNYYETLYFSETNGASGVGYMYGGNTSLEDNRSNTTSSTIKTYIDNWYENNLLTNYDKYISKTAIYCNDRSVGEGTWGTSSIFFFGAYTRLDTNKAPTYKCGGNTSGGLFESSQATQDKFSASTTGGGNGQLTYPIALMTADEIVFAGGKRNTELSSPYAYYSTNSAGSSINVGTTWWLMSPVRFYNGSDVFAIDGSRLSINSVVCASFDCAQARGVISIDSCAKVTGTGIPNDPYVIDESASTC